MAEAKTWYDESMEALKTLKEINGWDTEDDDYQNRLQDIKEGFNRKFDEELQHPAAAVPPDAKKGKAKGDQRKKRLSRRGRSSPSSRPRRSTTLSTNTRTSCHRVTRSGS